MTEHTKEPWTLANNEVRAHANGRLLARPSIDGGLIPPPERDANARRIVACVNACVGISTKALEGGSIVSVVAAAAALLDWTREHTSPRDINSPHALLVALADSIQAMKAEG